MKCQEAKTALNVSLSGARLEQEQGTAEKKDKELNPNSKTVNSKRGILEWELGVVCAALRGLEEVVWSQVEGKNVKCPHTEAGGSSGK